MTVKETFEKCLSITGAFEGAHWGGSIGNFDGAGISAFILQWNLGQGTLQPLLMEMYHSDPSKFDEIAGKIQAQKLVDVCLTPDREDVQAFVTEVTTGVEYKPPSEAVKHFDGGKLIKPSWMVVFAGLGENFRDQQVASAQKYFDAALILCKHFDLHTERGLAFCFDYAVQRGAKSLDDEYLAKEKDESKYDALTEIERMNWILVNDLPDFSQRWRGDVQSRRLCIINGEGRVHSTYYDLETAFKLTDEPFNNS